MYTTGYNDMTTPGMYKMINTASNAPVQNIGFGLFVILTGGDNLAQVAFRANGDIWHRARSGGTWSTWANL